MLAGKGDIRRFFDRVEEVRKKFQLVKNDQQKFNDIWQEIQPLQVALQTGLHGEGSLFTKTLKTVLTPEQSARYEHDERERRAFHFRARVEIVVGLLDDVLSFGDEQRRKLTEILLEDTHPPRQFGQYDHYVVLFQMSRLPDERLQPAFDAAQWRHWQNHRGRFQGLEPFLKQNGLLPDSP